MEAWNEAESTFLTAAAKVYAALKISNPEGNYGTDIVVDLNVDGGTYRCRCDCTGVIQCIIRVMGYDPNWGSSPRGGDGYFLTDATTSFVMDKNGNISPDWAVLPFDPDDCKPGDIRAARSHSHCDIFVDYKGTFAYGLNAGSGPNTGGQAIPLSCAGAVAYLQSNEQDSLVATWTIQDDDAATVLRYVKGSGYSGPTSGVTVSSRQSLRSLDVELQFVQSVEFNYQILDAQGLYSRVNPGYRPNNAYYPSPGGIPATDSYGDSWLEFVPSYIARFTDSDKEWEEAIKAGLVMLYTLDGSDPMLFGRTIYLKEDGTNDYDASKNWVPIIRTQFPVYFRCVLTDVATHTKDYGRSSAYFTNSSAEDSNASQESLDKALENCSFIYDAAGKTPECEDAHGYLFLNDETETYDRSEYITWIQGLEE